mgnify:FL=1
MLHLLTETTAVIGSVPRPSISSTLERMQLAAPEVNAATSTELQPSEDIRPCVGNEDDQSTPYIETVPLLSSSPTGIHTSLFLSHSKFSKAKYTR